MNSTNKALNTTVEAVKKRYSVIDTTIVMDNQAAFDVSNEDVISVLTYLRTDGWRQLSMLTCVDWIAEGKFQLVYILMNWENGVRLQVRTKIPRDNASFITATKVYPGAQYYERDVHEFFGVVFEGNPESLKQLFLENWDDMPPMRKDFNSRGYSDKKYEKRTYKKNFLGKAGE